MSEFEAIRPYNDKEVSGVVARLVADSDLLHAVGLFISPRLSRSFPWLARWLVARVLKRNTRDLTDVAAVQAMFANYFGRMIETTVSDFTCSGLDDLEANKPYLFIANHRDITLDSGFLNYALLQHGFATTQIAIGDNLISESFASDLFRLNKSFVIERSAKGVKAIFRALSRSSRYIRHSLEEGESVWIAQREGRAKNGIDITEPALIKMLGLAYRKDVEHFADYLKVVNLVPVAVSYELDPCDQMKARELATIARDGSYNKPDGEDLRSIVKGITGFKGRVHLNFGKPVSGAHEKPEEVAIAVDAAISAGVKIFPTHIEAAKLLDKPSAVACDSQPLAKVTEAFEDHLSSCSDEERPFLLAQYANQIR